MWDTTRQPFYANVHSKGANMIQLIQAATKFTVPEGYDLTSSIPKLTFICIAAGLIGVIATMLILLFLVRKRHKWPFFGVMAGVSTYLVFYYFSISTVVPVIFGLTPLGSFQNNAFVVASVYIVISALFMYGGRLLCYKVFSMRANTFAEGISFGIGIFLTEGIISVANLFLSTVSCATTNSLGIEQVASVAQNQKEYTQILDMVFQFINHPFDQLYTGMFTMLILVFHLAITVPFFAVYQKKLPKIWSLYSLGGIFLIQAIKYLGAFDVLMQGVQLMLYTIVVMGTVLLALRIYYREYKDEEYVQPDKRGDQPKKKMPKFENLSKL